MGRYTGVYTDRTHTNNYDTVIIDPIGELMEKLTCKRADNKLVQRDSQPDGLGSGLKSNVPKNHA